MTLAIVTAKELTEKLGNELGILSVNNLMQQLQIEKQAELHAADQVELARLRLLVEDLRTQVITLSPRDPKKARSTRG